LPLTLLLFPSRICAPGLTKPFPTRPSAIRKLHDSVSDPKYFGVRTTREQLLQESDESPPGENEDDVDFRGAEAGERDEGEDVLLQSGLHDDDDEDEGEGDAGAHPIEAELAAPLEEPKDQDLPTSLQKAREEDRKKGKAVVKQIVGVPFYHSLKPSYFFPSGAVRRAPRGPHPPAEECHTREHASQCCVFPASGSAVLG
jgi:protein AATF/BFR2